MAARNVPLTNAVVIFGQNLLKTTAELLVALLKSEYDPARCAWNQRQADSMCALFYNVFACVEELPIQWRVERFLKADRSSVSTRTIRMSMPVSIYDQIREKVEELSGTAGAFGSINNVKGGTEIKIKYQPLPDPGTRVVSVVPYLVGSSDPSSTTLPPVALQRLLAWQYNPDPKPENEPAWRCFKFAQIKEFMSGPAPRPPDNELPTLDEDGQNCVRSW